MSTNPSNPKKRTSPRSATKQKTAQSISNNYKKQHGLNRQRNKPVAYVPCPTKSSPYHGAWPPTTIGYTVTAIEINQAANLDTKQFVETLGDKGAKWYLCTQVINKSVEDGDPNQPFKQGYFYSFSGAHTFDCVYVDATSGDVYVIEAKGTKKGGGKNLITRASGKTQGNFDYMDEVTNEMNNSGDAHKQAAAQAILNAKPGKLHYIGVKTSYDTDATSGKVTAKQPKEIFNKSR